MAPKPTYIDLFAGCGGLSLGLYNAGWKGMFAIEKNKSAFDTLKYNLIDGKNHFNWPEWLTPINHEIDEVLLKYKSELLNLRGSVDMVAGGPPCQGFSTAGRRNENDIRNGLVRSYLKFISYVRPKLIFFENVKGFTQKFEKNKSKGEAYSNYVLTVLRRLGYDVEGRMIDFSRFGIPQKRTRFILVGIRNDVATDQITAKLFYRLINRNKKSFLKSKELPQMPSLASAISDLLKSNGTVSTPDRKRFSTGKYSVGPRSKYQLFLRDGDKSVAPSSHSFTNHSPKVVERFTEFLKSERGNKNVSKKTKKALNIVKHVIIPLSGKSPAPTLTTLPDDYIHYKEPRILTVREYARIQSFPDWYTFQGPYTTGGKERKQQVPRYTQIGNAIPPLFSEQSGIVLKQLIS